MDSGEDASFIQARAVLIDDITKSLARTTTSMRQLNTQMTVIKERGEKIAALSSAWSQLVSQSKSQSE